MPDARSCKASPSSADPPDPLPGEGADPAAWAAAEAALAAPLARAAARLGALDERLLHGPAGWRQRLALVEAGELGWVAGARVAPERLALWLALRLGGVQADAQALLRLGWAVRRLGGGPGPEAGPAAFLDRQPPPGDWAGGGPGDWAAALAAAAGLHPLSRGALVFDRWSRAGPGHADDALEAAVAAARLAAGDCRGGAVFAPLAMGGAGALRARGPLPERLARWYAGAASAALAGLRLLDGLEAWQARARAATAGLSGRTPGRLVALLAAWPLVSAPMAARLTGASRAAVQRNLARLEAAGLIREVTGQGRFRVWTART